MKGVKVNSTQESETTKYSKNKYPDHAKKMNALELENSERNTLRKRYKFPIETQNREELSKNSKFKSPNPPNFINNFILCCLLLLNKMVRSAINVPHSFTNK